MDSVSDKYSELNNKQRLFYQRYNMQNVYQEYTA